MSDDDLIREALAGLRDSAAPHVRPPGVDAVERTVRRRLANRAAGAAAAAVAIVMAAFFVPVGGTGSPGPAEPTGTASASHTPSPTPTPAPAVTADGSQTTAAAGSDQCDRNPWANGSWQGTLKEAVWFRLFPQVDGDTICAGAWHWVFWVTYQRQPDGAQQLFSFQKFTLDPGVLYQGPFTHPPTCAGDWYIGSGDYMIPTVLPAGVHDPFPVRSSRTGDGAIERQHADGPCGTATSSNPPASPSP